MQARPCSGSRPKVNGSTTITVMVMVMPGSAPPTTPISVPMKSGSRYLTCSSETMPCPRSSNINARTLEVRPAPARHQHGQVTLEDVVHDYRSHYRYGCYSRPSSRGLGQVKQGIGRGDIQESRDAEAEERQRAAVQAEDGEHRHHQPVVQLLALGHLLFFPEGKDKDKKRQNRRDTQHDPRVV